MINKIPFVQRTSQLCPRRGYSTALSARYDGWAGLYDEHGQHTIVLIEYDWQVYETKNYPHGSLQRLHPLDRLYGSEICRRKYLRQMGKHQRISRQEKGSGVDVAIETLKNKTLNQRNNETLHRNTYQRSARADNAREIHQRAPSVINNPLIYFLQ